MFLTAFHYQGVLIRQKSPGFLLTLIQKFVKIMIQIHKYCANYPHIFLDDMVLLRFSIYSFSVLILSFGVRLLRGMLPRNYAHCFSVKKYLPTGRLRKF